MNEGMRLSLPSSCVLSVFTVIGASRAETTIGNFISTHTVSLFLNSFIYIYIYDGTMRNDRSKSARNKDGVFANTNEESEEIGK